MTIDRPENLALDEQFDPLVNFTARPGGRAAACDVFQQTPARSLTSQRAAAATFDQARGIDLTSRRAAAADLFTQTGAKEHVLRAC